MKREKLLLAQETLRKCSPLTDSVEFCRLSHRNIAFIGLRTEQTSKNSMCTSKEAMCEEMRFKAGVPEFYFPTSKCCFLIDRGGERSKAIVSLCSNGVVVRRSDNMYLTKSPSDGERGEPGRSGGGGKGQPLSSLSSSLRSSVRLQFRPVRYEASLIILKGFQGRRRGVESARSASFRIRRIS